MVLTWPGDLVFNCLRKVNLLFLERETLHYHSVPMTVSWESQHVGCNKRKKTALWIWLVMCAFALMVVPAKPAGCQHAQSLWTQSESAFFITEAMFGPEREIKDALCRYSSVTDNHYSRECRTVWCCSIALCLFSAAFMSLNEAKMWLEAWDAGLCLLS